MTNFDHKEIDDIIHGRVRLAIMSLLASQGRKAGTTDMDVDFSRLKRLVNASDGNLSTHLHKLEDAGYVKVTKQFKDKRPQTLCRLSEKGRTAFMIYLSRLEKLLPPK